jgi:CRP-like cAMP-binding protein
VISGDRRLICARPAVYRRGLSSGAYFDHDGSWAAATATTRPELLPSASESDWDRLLSYCSTLRFRSGETVLDTGRPDRALYILADGRLDHATAPAVIGEAEFFTGLPRTHAYRAETDGELLRLNFTDFEALAAREPRIARDLLLDLGRLLALKLRS